MSFSRKPTGIIIGYVREMFAEKELAPDDYLCFNLAHKVEKHLAQEFSRIVTVHVSGTSGRA
jgi:hypothetical protein